MANKTFALILDLFINLKSNKGDIEKTTKDLETQIKARSPAINIDSSKLKESVKNIVKQLDSLDIAAEELDKKLNEMDMKLDTKDAEKSMQMITDMLKNVGNMDLSKLESALDGLSDGDLEKVGSKLQDAFENFDADKLKKDMKNIENEAEIMRQNIEKATAEYNKQRSEVALLAKAGKKNTDEYKEAQKELKKRGDELKKIKQAEEDIGKAIGKSNSALGMLDNLQKFGLISEGINNFANSMVTMTTPFMQLDTATNKIKTLGGAAKENADEFRNVAKEMSQDMPIGAEVLQTATYDALSAGISATKEDIESFMTAASKLAVGGGEEVGNTVNLLSSLNNAYGIAAEKTMETSDILFQTVNLGKTSVQELNGSLSNVIPTAAAYGFSLKNVGASLALMTANGIPTAQATTKLNQLMLEMQKPGAELSKILENAGTSAEQLGKKVKSGDVIGALHDMDAAFKLSGKSATQAFSSAESGAAFNVLTKDFGKLQSTMDAFSGSAGTTEAAYKDMSQTIENRTKLMKSQIDNIMISAVDMSGAFGTTLVTLGQMAGELAPTITAFAGMQTMFGGIAKSLLEKLVPSLFTTATAEVAAGTAGSAAGWSTAAAWIAAALPLVAVIALVGVLVKGLMWLADIANETAQERKEAAKEEEKALETQKKSLEAQKQRIQGNTDLIKSFEELGNKQNKTAEEEEQFRQMQIKLAQAYPGVISSTKTFAENLAGLKDASSKSTGELKKIDEKLEELDLKLQKNRVIQLKAEVDINQEKLEDDLNKAFSGRGGNAYNARVQMQDYIKALKEAKNSDELAKISTDMQLAVFNNGEIDPKLQTDIVNNIIAMTKKQGEAIDQETKNNTVNMKKAVSSAFKEGNISDADLKAIATKYGKTVEEVGTFYDDIKNKAKNEKIGDILKSSAEIKGSLDENNKVGELVEKFKNATSDIEKASIAEAIKKQAPDAVQATGSIITEEGKLVNQYEILTDKIDESSEAQKGRFSSDMQKKQADFINTILGEKDAYQQNIVEMNRMKTERDRLAAQGLDTSKIDADINKLGAENQQFINDTIKNIIKWEEQGNDTTAVYEEVAKTLGKSPDEVKKLVAEQKKSVKQAEQQLTLAEKLAAKWNESTSAVSKKLGENSDALLAFDEEIKRIAKISLSQRTTEEQDFWENRTKKRNELWKETVQLNKQNNDYAKAEENLQNKLNPQYKSAFETAKAKSELDKKALETAAKQKEIADKLLLLSEEREANEYDNLITAKDKLKLLEDQKKTLIDTFKITEDKGEIVIGIKAKAEEKAEVADEIVNLEQSIQEASMDMQGILIQIRLDTQDADQQIAEYEKERTLYKIELGITGAEGFDNILSGLKNKLDVQKEALNIANLELDELNKKMYDAMSNADNDEERQAIANQYSYMISQRKLLNLEILKSVDETETEITDIQEQKLEYRLDALKDYYDKQDQLSEVQNKKAKEKAEKFSNVIADALSSAIQNGHSKELGRVKSQEDEKLALLESYKEQELISQEDYEKRKTAILENGENKRAKIEEDTRRKELRTQAFIEGQKLEQQRQADINNITLELNRALAKRQIIEDTSKPILEANKTSLTEIQELYRKYAAFEKEDLIKGHNEKRAVEMQLIQKDLNIKLDGMSKTERETIKQLTETTDTLNQQYAEKGDIILSGLEIIGDGVTEAMIRAMGGDSNSVVDVLRKTFAQILGTTAEFLTKEVDAAILKLILSWFNSPDMQALPFFARIALVPAAQALSSGLIHGIADPLINKIASFNTGGQIDQPTLALIGDASVNGMPNTEWVMNNKNMQQFAAMTAAMSGTDTANEIRQLRKELAGQKLHAELKGQDINISLRRTQYQNSNRSR